ncbi:MAG: hypothetical protein OJF47_004054 [Nitrospira sp.]|nr:MAG: hypothetical protein OJF47_004054 [Nitrospira sp.]
MQIVMVDAGLSFGAGLLIGGFGLMLAWGLLWLVVGTVGLMRQTCGWAIVLSSVSSSAIAALSITGVLWAAGAAGSSGPAFHIGLMTLPLALLVTAFFRLKDGRRIGPAFVEGSRVMLHQLLGIHQEGCGHCHEQPSQVSPCQEKS